MAITDARPIPRYGEPYCVYFPVFHETGTVQHVAGVTASISLDRGAFAASTNTVTAIDDSGYFYLELTAEEMTANTVIVHPNPHDNDFRTPPLIIYPEQPGDMRTHTLTIEDPITGEIATAVLSSPIPGPHDPDSLGGVLGNLIGNMPTKLVIVSPIIEGGNLLLVRGDDYLSVDGRAITWTENSGTWPDLSTATVYLVIGSSKFFRKEITATTPTGNPKVLRAELTRADTNKLTQSAYNFIVEAVMSTGSHVTLIKGSVRMTAGL
jgi:hypothetical protein